MFSWELDGSSLTRFGLMDSRYAVKDVVLWKFPRAYLKSLVDEKMCNEFLIRIQVMGQKYIMRCNTNLKIVIFSLLFPKLIISALRYICMEWDSCCVKACAIKDYSESIIHYRIIRIKYYTPLYNSFFKLRNKSNFIHVILKLIVKKNRICPWGGDSCCIKVYKRCNCTTTANYTGVQN